MVRVAAALVFFLVACGSTPPPGLDGGLPLPGTDGGPVVDGGPAADGGIATTTYSLSVGGLDLAPGSETTWCVVRRLDNIEPALVTRIETTLSEGSHHLIVYKTDDTVEQTDPFECTPFTETIKGRAVPLLISQIRDEQVILPDGVVYELAARQMVRIEAHYINTGAAALKPTVNVQFHARQDEAGLQRAGFLFFGTPDIDLQAQTVATVGPRFIKTGIPDGAQIFAMTTHTHQWGTQFKVWKSTSRDYLGTSIYDYAQWNWDEPPVKQFDPPLTFASGEGVRFICEYNNQSGSRVRFGESAEAEMCFLWLYYYPDDGYRLCIDTTQVGLGEACCPGHAACGLIADQF